MTNGRQTRRPASTFDVDGYGVVVGPPSAIAWLGGFREQHPTELVLANGTRVALNKETSRVRACYGTPCTAYVQYLPRTHTAERVMGVTTRGAGLVRLEGVPVWEIAPHAVVLSNGARLRSVMTAPGYSSDQVRAIGPLVSLELDNTGAVRAIIGGGCA